MMIVHFVGRATTLTFRACETAAKQFQEVWNAHHALTTPRPYRRPALSRRLHYSAGNRAGELPT